MDIKDWMNWVVLLDWVDSKDVMGWNEWMDWKD